MILIPNNSARWQLRQQRPKLNDPSDILEQCKRVKTLRHLAKSRVCDLSSEQKVLVDDLIPSPITLPNVERFADTRINRLYIPHPHARRHLTCDTFQDVFLVYHDGRFCIFKEGAIDIRSTAVPGQGAMRAIARGQYSSLGSGAFCGDHWLPGNPAHFISDQLTRALILRDRVGMSSDQIYLPETHATVCNFLRQQIDPAFRTLEPDRVHFFPELKLLSSSRFDKSPGHPFWFLDPDILAIVSAGAQRNFRADPAEGSKIYLSRTDTTRRRMLNEPELIRRLQALGVKPVLMSQLSGPDQLGAIYNADMIIAPHGGALLNLIAARKGTRVIELFTPERGTLAFAGIALALGLKYDFQFGQPENTTEKHDLPWCADIEAICAMITKT
tara:strand:+ start:1731 stop:2888 length:1158 start_codon:yes stop_codon:yes gene_type:complete